MSVVALAVTSLLGGCCHTHGGYYHPVPISPELHDAAQAHASQQLYAAETTTHVWNRDSQRAFNFDLSRLTSDEAFELSRQLSGLISTNKVRLDFGPPAAEPPPCTCSCTGTHTTAAAGSGSAPTDKITGITGSATPARPLPPMSPASASGAALQKNQ